jgi:hypothetical protein
MEACEQQGPKGKERGGGVRYGNESENREPTRVPGTEGRTVRHDEASVAQRCGHTRANTWVPPQTVFAEHAVTATWDAQRDQTGHRNDVRSGDSISLTYVRLTFLLVFSFFFSFLQNHVTPITWVEHRYINSLWISRLNTQIFLPRGIFIARAVLRGNLVKALGQQPRYQRAPSSTTMWSRSTGGPQFRRGTISY